MPLADVGNRSLAGCPLINRRVGMSDRVSYEGASRSPVRRKWLGGIDNFKIGASVTSQKYASSLLLPEETLLMFYEYVEHFLIKMKQMMLSFRGPRIYESHAGHPACRGGFVFSVPAV